MSKRHNARNPEFDPTDARILDYRGTGMSYRRISEALNNPPTTADGELLHTPISLSHVAVRDRYLKAMAIMCPPEERDLRRGQENATLDELQQQLFTDMRRLRRDEVDLRQKLVGRVLQVVKARRELNGLDEPRRIQIDGLSTDPLSQEVDKAMRDIEALLERSSG